MENLEELYKELDSLNYSIKLLKNCIKTITDDTEKLEIKKEEIERKLDKIRKSK